MDKIDELRQAFDTLRYNGIVSTQQDFADYIGVGRTGLCRALGGDNKYLTDSLMSKVRAKMHGNSFDTPDASSIPVIPTGARAGTLGDFSAAVTEYDCERIISPIRGADYAIQVTGDSMSPDYPNGSHILIKKIDEKAFIEWGKAYVLDTVNGPVLKIVMPTESEDTVRCVSVNQAYPPFTVKMSSIIGWYRVLMALALK